MKDIKSNDFAEITGGWTKCALMGVGCLSLVGGYFYLNRNTQTKNSFNWKELFNFQFAKNLNSTKKAPAKRKKISNLNDILG